MKWRFHPGARKEHLQHVSRYEGIRQGLGAAYLSEFESAIASICEGPQRSASADLPDVHRFHLKRFPFTVYFQVCDEVVVVFAVSHKRRHPEYWTGRM